MINLKIIEKLYTNNKLVCDIECSCKNKNNIYSYKYDNNKITFNISEQYFIRETSEYILKLSNNKYSLNLKEINKDFEIELKDYSFNFNDNTLKIAYKLDENDDAKLIIINIIQRNI